MFRTLKGEVWPHICACSEPLWVKDHCGVRAVAVRGGQKKQTSPKMGAIRQEVWRGGEGRRGESPSTWISPRQLQHWKDFPEVWVKLALTLTLSRGRGHPRPADTASTHSSGLRSGGWPRDRVTEAEKEREREREREREGRGARVRASGGGKCNTFLHECTAVQPATFASP